MERTWFYFNKSGQLPTPGVPCMVRFEDGTEQWAIRPNYISSYKDDPNFRNRHGEYLSGVIAWAIY